MAVSVADCWQCSKLNCYSGLKFRLHARLNCGGNVGTRTRDFLRDSYEEILVGNEATPKLKYVAAITWNSQRAR
jgi:hypothetical protein